MDSSKLPLTFSKLGASLRGEFVRPEERILANEDEGDRFCNKECQQTGGEAIMDPYKLLLTSREVESFRFVRP